jgi:hypothetical protein
MAVFLSPIGNGFQFMDEVGQPLNSGLLYTYLAGTSTPQPTFTTVLGNVQNANPIELNADGRPPYEIWFTAGITYDFALHDADDNLIRTYEDLPGINDSSGDASFNNLNVTNDLTVGGDTELGGDLQVDGNVNIDGNLTVGGDATFDGDVTFNGDIIGLRQWCQWAIGDQTSVMSADTDLMQIAMPAPGTFLTVQGFVNTASSSGTITFDINKNTTSILSTKITIEVNEKNSLDATSQPVISTASFVAGDIISFDIDGAGTGAKGPVITARVRWS